jgi:nitroreductase
MELIKSSESRKTDYPIDELFLNRWSPRAMSGESISDSELFSLFEAARWTPSNQNEQPWAFIYAKAGTDAFEKIFGCLVDFNKLWCKNASALIVLAARKTFAREGNPQNPNHMSDAGAAWENLALQASLKGIVAHGMGGFNREMIRATTHLPETYEIIHLIAVGKPAPKEVLPERMQKSETPSARKPINEFIFEGKFNQTV